MADPRIGRFFSPKTLVIALGIGALGLLAGAYTVYLFLFENLISFTFGLLTLALLAGGVATLAAAFPTGCKACRRKFEEAGAVFAPNLFDHLVQVFQSGDPNAVGQLAMAPGGDPAGQKAVFNIRYCPTCRALAEVDVILEHWTGQYNETDRTQPTIVVSGPAVEAALQVVNHKAAQVAGGPV